MAHHSPQRLAAAVVASLALLVPSLVQAAKPSVAERVEVQTDPGRHRLRHSRCRRRSKTVHSNSSMPGKSRDGKCVTPTATCCAATSTPTRDKKVDQWCYFKNGIEVYRDIDSNHNRKADQYRWLGTAGIRWAIDTERGRSHRPVEGDFAGRGVRRSRAGPDHEGRRSLQAPAAHPEELRDLGLGDEQAKQLAQKLAATARGYEELLRKQDIVKPRCPVGQFRRYPTWRGPRGDRWVRNAICTSTRMWPP